MRDDEYMRPDIGKGEVPKLTLSIEEIEDADLEQQELPEKYWDIEYYINYIQPEYFTKRLTIRCKTIPDQELIKMEILGTQYVDNNHLLKITKVKEYIKDVG